MNRDGWLDLLLSAAAPASCRVYYGSKRRLRADQPEFKLTDAGRPSWTNARIRRIAPGAMAAGHHPVTHYYGSCSGLSEETTLELPTDAGTGSQVSDYNRDGYADLLLYCHRSEGDPNKPGRYGDHTTDSFLYWGGPKGFDVNRKLLIPGEGVHYDGGIDLGNIKDRGFQFDYISPAHHHGNRTPRRIEWKAQTPYKSRVLMQVRTAPDEQALERAKWVGPRGVDSAYESSASRLATPAWHGWIQYRALRVSPTAAVSPALEKVSIHFE